MQAKTTGIVIHQVKYTDSSVIVTVYTKLFGKMAFLVRGISSKKSAFKTALFQPLSIIEIDISHHPKRSLQQLKDVRILTPFYDIPYNPVKNTLALFMAELLHKTVDYTNEDEDLYSYLENSIIELDNCKDGLGNFHLVFMIGLTRWLGFAPNPELSVNALYFDMINGVFDTEQPNHTHFTNESSTENLIKLLNIDYSCLSDVSLSKSQRAELLEHLIKYFKLHLDNFYSLQSVEVLHEVWK